MQAGCGGAVVLAEAEDNAHFARLDGVEGAGHRLQDNEGGHDGNDLARAAEGSGRPLRGRFARRTLGRFLVPAGKGVANFLDERGEQVFRPAGLFFLAPGGLFVHGHAEYSGVERMNGSAATRGCERLFTG